MSSIPITRHAAERIREFGLSQGVVTEIATRYDVAHTNARGESVRTSDRHPDWTVVLGNDGVVITVLRRTLERWEHHSLPGGRSLAITRPISSTPPRVEDAAAADTPPVRRRGRRRAAPATQVRPVVVSRVDPDLLRQATRAADGDLRRLVIGTDGSVTVLNRPRGSR